MYIYSLGVVVLVGSEERPAFPESLIVSYTVYDILLIIHKSQYGEERGIASFS